MTTLKEHLINKNTISNLKKMRTIGILREGDIVLLENGDYYLCSFKKNEYYAPCYLVNSYGWIDLSHFDTKTLVLLDRFKFHGSTGFDITKVFRPSKRIDYNYEHELTQQILKTTANHSKLVFSK